jgi:hypothetical protein
MLNLISNVLLRGSKFPEFGGIRELQFDESPRVCSTFGLIALLYKCMRFFHNSSRTDLALIFFASNFRVCAFFALRLRSFLFGSAVEAEVLPHLFLECNCFPFCYAL